MPDFFRILDSDKSTKYIDEHSISYKKFCLSEIVFKETSRFKNNQENSRIIKTFYNISKHFQTCLESSKKLQSSRIT